MITRSTNQTLTLAAQRNLQSNMTRMAALQEKVSTQQKISRPSDDPSGTAASLKVRAEQAAVQQYGRNIANGNGWLTTLDSAMGTATGILNRIRDLTLQGANDSAPPAARQAIAVELEGLRADLLSQANTQYLGRSVFAGTSDAAGAYTSGQPPVFNGVAGAVVERRIAPGTTVRVDADGAAVFGTGTGSVFSLVDSIVADLRGGTNIGKHIAAIDARHEAFIGQYADIGTRHAQLLRAEEMNMDLAGLLEAQRSGVEDVDAGQAILEMNLQEVNYRTALAVTAKVLQPTLMDFLR
ncbi:flagellar hook-associated protein 3 [Pseudarthrobacter phenanthrenivorans]|nr:flagellar hook-associated protein FlgL [Pseudarthrobacter phenanthrenivorans]TPV52554.1 flagellar hook-associated protein 3 [Pseudarthrobacter phenanthrenivorans]